MSLIDNTPDLWLSEFPRLKAYGNKYDRGHALILGGPVHSTGAVRLAARAALRTGAGLVSVACDRASLPVYAAALEAVMTKPVRTLENFEALLADPRITSVLLGPGAGINERTADCTLSALRSGRTCVLDADALTVFKPVPRVLFKAITGPVLMTPHDGEFGRVFGRIENRVADVMRAAQTSGAVVLLKGADTLIAAPDGRMAVNRAAPPQLATAGSGDVLAGIATGLVTQGMDVFAAACAAAWIHAEAARQFGIGLIAEDLEKQIPAILTWLNQPSNSQTLRLTRPGQS